MVDWAQFNVKNEGNESKIKSTYNVLTDFIFNGGTIKGYTFNSAYLIYKNQKSSENVIIIHHKNQRKTS